MPFGPTTLLQQDDVMSKDKINTFLLQPMADLIAPPFASYNKPITDPNITTTSATFTPIDATNFNLTIVTKGNPVMLTFRAAFLHSTLGATVSFEIFIDGVAYGGGANGIAVVNEYVANNILMASFTEIIPIVAGMHTFQMNWRTSVATATILAAQFPQMTVREL